MISTMWWWAIVWILIALPLGLVWMMIILVYVDAEVIMVRYTT